MSVYPGVRELVETLAARDDVVVGLLTGNIEAGARIKLRPTGLLAALPAGRVRVGRCRPDPAPAGGGRAG